MVKKIGAAAMAAMMFMAIFTGCKKAEPKRSDEPVSTFATLKSSEGEKVFEDLEPLSYQTVIEGSDYNQFVFNFAGSAWVDKDENMMVSPASLFFAMEMLGAGANGNTLTEISNALVPGASNEEALAFAADYYKSLSSDENETIKLANEILIREDIGGTYYEDYLNYVKDNFDAEVKVEPFDGNTVTKVNEWVNEHTDGMIPEIIKNLNENTSMILVDAIAFDAKWENKYEEYDILEDSTFTNSKGEKEDVTLLYSGEEVYFETDKATGFMKYYEGEDFAFVAVLPKDESITANEFLEGFTSEDYKAFLDSRTNDTVNAYIPEFSYDYANDDIVNLLKDMGIHDAFEGGKADFSNMSTHSQAISQIIQKTHIELTSEGTKAAAATAIMVEDACVPIEADPPKTVRLDRAFAYMIVDTETNTPVFVGSVNSVNG
ncbi:MAG: serpin family protein [Clostridia bacterium]|nr:serpin family protein [Clostridia bacterium]